MEGIAKNLNAALVADKVELIMAIAADYGLNAEELIKTYINADIRPKKTYQKKKKQDYVETEEVSYDGTKYLVDAKNQVYTYNIEKPLMVGERLVDGSIKFFDAYLATCPVRTDEPTE